MTRNKTGPAIVLLGGGGDVGLGVLPGLAPYASRIRIVDRNEITENLYDDERAALNSPHIEFVKFDLLSPAQELAPLIRGFDAVIHLATSGVESCTWEQAIASVTMVRHTCLAMREVETPLCIYLGSNRISIGWQKKRPNQIVQMADGVCTEENYGLGKAMSVPLLENERNWASVNGKSLAVMVLHLGTSKRGWGREQRDFPQNALQSRKYIHRDDLSRLLIGFIEKGCEIGWWEGFVAGHNSDRLLECEYPEQLAEYLPQIDMRACARNTVLPEEA